MNIRRVLALALSVTTFATSSVSVIAAPKQMADGTMFDAEFYAQTYPDVANAVGTNEEALYNHYIQCGKAEGRKATANGTAATIATSQPVANSSSNSILYNSKFGIFRYYAGPKSATSDKNETKFVEGGGFDEVRYAADYPEVAAAVGTSHAALWNHFKTKGFYEGRKAHYKYTDQDWNYANYYSRVEMICVLPTICNENMTDLEKIVAVKDWLRSYASYNSGKSSVYDFWFGHNVNCMGYTNMFTTAMQLLGIQENGWGHSSPGGVDHVYNRVIINGQSVDVDVTWNLIGSHGE